MAGDPTIARWCIQCEALVMLPAVQATATKLVSTTKLPKGWTIVETLESDRYGLLCSDECAAKYEVKP